MSFLIAILFVAFAAETSSNPRWERTISHSPVAVREGQHVVFHTTIEAALGPVSNLEISGGVDGTPLLNKTIARLSQNQKLAVSFRWRAQAGTHKAYFQIDPQRKMLDSDRGDNLVQLSLNVSRLAGTAPRSGVRAKPSTAGIAKIGPQAGQAMPDLTVLRMDAYDSLSGKREFRRGAPITVEATVKNVGQAASGPFWVQLEIKTQEFHTGRGAPTVNFAYEKLSVASLEPGKEKTISFALGPQMNPAYAIAYDFTMQVDFNNRVVEFEEDNNSLSRRVDRRPQ